MNILIKDAKILDMIKEEIFSGNIYIENEKIEYIGNDFNFKADKIIDGKGKLAMPGFINAHTHVGMSLFRNYSDDVNLQTWLEDNIWPLEENLEAEDVYIASLLSMSEMIMTGTTTFADMYFFEEETIKALKLSKMRAHLSRGLTIPDFEDYRIKENLNLFDKFNYTQSGRIQIGFGPHAIYTTDKEYLKKIAKLSKDKNIPIHIHLSETKKENDDCIKKYGKTPTEVLEECNIFENKTIAAHGVHLSDTDLDILAKYDVSIIHNPSSNLKLSSGFLDVRRLLDRGINVAIGTDSAASNNNLSIIKEISIAALVSKYKDPKNLSAFEVLKMATINGAKALGIDDKVASLEKGKLADIILIDIENVNHIPNNNLISSLVYSTYDEDIVCTIINGEIVYENNKFIHINQKELIKKASQCFEKLRTR